MISVNCSDNFGELEIRARAAGWSDIYLEKIGRPLKKDLQSMRGGSREIVLGIA